MEYLSRNELDQYVKNDLPLDSYVVIRKDNLIKLYCKAYRSALNDLNEGLFLDHNYSNLQDYLNKTINSLSLNQCIDRFINKFKG